jgi:hypothetical protein
MKSYFKKMSRKCGFHGMILLKGFIKMLWGTVLTAMIAGSVYGFLAIPSEGGYAAVGDFLISVSIVGVAFIGIYLMGGNGGKGAKK